MSNYFILGNWKSHGRAEDLEAFGNTYNQKAKKLPNSVKAGVALPYHLIAQASSLKPHWAGAQNVSAFAEGAYTGEITSGMLETLQTDFCIIGHSERRQYFGETVADTENKLHQLIDTGIFPVFCVGETLEQRQSGSLEPVLRDQLAPVVGLQEGQLAIAYEPVWAIGTGVAATPADVARSHGLIRGILEGSALQDAPILYGGSVKPHNAEELATINEVAGFLIGGASLKADSFAEITASFLIGKQI